MKISVASAYDQLVLQNPKTIIAVLFGLLVVFGYYAKDFKIDASAESLLLEGDPDLKTFRSIRQRYPANDLLVVTYTPKQEMFSNEVITALGKLRSDLKKVNGVASVFTLLDVPLFESSEALHAEFSSDLPNLSQPGIVLNRARAELLNSPYFRDLIISADGRTTALLIEMTEEKKYFDLLQVRYDLRAKQETSALTGNDEDKLARVNSEIDRILEAINDQRHRSIKKIRDLLRPYQAGAEVYLGGTPMITDDMVRFVQNDLIVFGGGVFLLLVLVLAAIFREIRWVVLPLITCFYAGMVMMGVLGFAGWKVTVISSNFLALMLIITLSMNVHLIVRYREILNEQPDSSQFVLVRETTHKMAKPCLYTALTTIIGFGSLVVSGIKPVIDFGWMMSAGLAVTFVTSFLLFPTLLLVIGKPARHRAPIRMWTLLPKFCGEMTERHGGKILAISVILAGVSVAGILQLRVENSFINYFSDKTEIYRGLSLIDKKLGGTTPVEILLRFNDTYALRPEDLEGLSPEDIEMEREYAAERANSPKYWFTTEKIRQIKEVHDYLEQRPEIGKVLSLASAIRLAEALVEEELDGARLAILYSKLPTSLKGDLIDSYVSFDHNETRIFGRVLDSNPDVRRKELIESVNSDLTEDLGWKAEDVTVSGLLVLYNNMLQSLFDSQIKTLGVVMLGIALMFMILFRSIKLAIVGILPNLLSAVLVLGFMGLAGVPLDMMTITIAAITIGIAVDDDIHYIYRFREEFPRSRSYLKTMHACHASIGEAIFHTSLTVTVGFSVLLLSNFIPTIYFGVLTATAMFIALFASLTVLPNLIMMWKPFGPEQSEPSNSY